MSRHDHGRSPKPWSKLKSRVEALFAPGLPLAIHCNVFVKVTKEFTFDEPRHWIMLVLQPGFMRLDLCSPAPMAAARALLVAPAPVRPSQGSNGFGWVRPDEMPK